MPSENGKPTVAEYLQGLERRVAELEAWKAGVIAALTGRSASCGGEIADDDELDSDHGDPKVRKTPPAKYWKGEPFAGKSLSRLTLAQLDAYGKYKDACAYAAEKNPDPEKPKQAKYIEYDRRDAARARGWARRIRGGWVAPPEPEGTSLDSSGDFDTSDPFGSTSDFGDGDLGNEDFDFGANAS
jgi:hypothetical protein